MAAAAFDLSQIPAIDDHCHPFEPAPLTWQLLLDSLSLSQRGQVSLRNGSKLLSRVAVNGLAAFFGCASTADEIIAVRNAASAANYAGYVGDLFASQRIGGLLVDPGYPDVPVIDAADFAARTPVPIWEGYRIERFFAGEGSFHGEEGAAPSQRFDDMLEAFGDELDRQAQRPGFAFYKSIMAYLTGLAIEPASLGDARYAWESHRAYGDAAEKVVRDFLFRVTCAKARQHGVPFQLHTGHTSHYRPWPTVNPILLLPVLNEPETGETSLVLVHGGYPNCTEAGYITSLYANVHCDLSLMNPWASAGVSRRILETLEWAPAEKVMYGSDGVDIPEVHWVGAVVGRRALGKALGELVADGYLSTVQAEDAAADILGRTAERVYGLRSRPPVPAALPELAKTGG